MKKVLLILATAATAMILFSCDKSAKKEPKVYETPIYKSLAAKYVVTDADATSSGFSSLELAPSGIYVLEMTSGEIKTGVFEKVESAAAVEHENRFRLKGWGMAYVMDPTKAEDAVYITFEPEGGASFHVLVEPVSPTGNPSAAVQAIVGHSFKVTATELIISDYKISKTFEGGCDIPEILKYLEGKINGFKADKDYSGFVVKDITLTDASFIVRFANQKDFTASLKVDANNEFGYKVSGSQSGNPIFNGEAKGKISFDKWNEPIVSVGAVIKDQGGKEYTGSVKFYLTEVDPTKA